MTHDATSGVRGPVPIERGVASPQASVATGMNAAEYEQFVQAVHAHRTTIEVDRVFAKKIYTTVPMDTMGQTIGEVPYFEKGIVCCALFAAPVFLVASIALSAFGLQWWTLIAAPIAVALWVGNRMRSRKEGAGIVLITLALAAAVVLGILGLIRNGWVLSGLVSFLLALWCDRLIYVASKSFLRTQVLRNQRALEAYAGGLTIRNGT